MEAAQRELQTKLTQLQMTRDRTETVLTSENSNRIKRHSRYKLLDTRQTKRDVNQKE